MIFQVRKVDSDTAPEATRKLFGLGLCGGGVGLLVGRCRTYMETYIRRDVEPAESQKATPSRPNKKV